MAISPNSGRVDHDDNIVYCMKPHKIKGEKCALFSILCASVLYLTQKCAIISTSVLYYPFDSGH